MIGLQIRASKLSASILRAESKSFPCDAIGSIIGSTAAFVYSTIALFAMTDAQVKGNSDEVISYMHEFYFESAATILTLITLGKMLEARSKGKTTDALKGLMKLSPKTATVLRDGEEITVPVEQVAKSDIFVVRPGENIPVDGTVLDGNSAVDESTPGVSISVTPRLTSLFLTRAGSSSWSHMATL